MNGVMLQAFHWFLDNGFPGDNGRKLWNFLRDEANHLRNIGINAVWIPPAYRGGNADGVGYDVYDHYNVGEFATEFNPSITTRYGTKQELHNAIASLHGNNNARKIEVYADIVLNHRASGKKDDFWTAIRVNKDDRTKERWGNGYEEGEIEIKAYTRFEFPERNNQYSSFKWSAKHFDSVDATSTVRQNGKEFNEPNEKYVYRFLFNEAGYDPHKKNFDRWVDLEKGNFDYLTSCDFDYGRPDVREEMKNWGSWYIREFDFDGIRLDAVKHISAHYMQEWVGHVRWTQNKNLFAVAEYISGGTDKFHTYIEQVTTYWDFPQPVTLFDFPLFFKFNQVSFDGERYDLANLFTGTLVAEQPTLAVTFVENHDYEYGRGWRCHVEAWFKPLGHAFILLRAGGYPCIFFPDYYGSYNVGAHKGYHSGRNYIDLLLRLRKQFAMGVELTYVNKSVAGWTRLGFVPGAKGAMAVVINTAYNRVQGINMQTGRSNKSFYHLATIRTTENGYLVVEGAYNLYGEKRQTLKSNAEGWGEFVADGGSVSIWLEDGVGLF